MDTYLKNLETKLQTEFNGDVIPIPLKKEEKQPLYSHANSPNDALWLRWKDMGFGEVLSENADLDLLIRNRAMVVVDFDSRDLYETFEDNIPQFKDTVKQSTKKGFHYFFKGTEETQEMKLSNCVRPFGESKDIDIITTWDKGTGGIITIYPSANKEWINNIIEKPILPLPSSFVKVFKNEAVHLKKDKKKEKKQKNDDGEEDDEECSYDVLKTVVMGLAPTRAVGFDDWSKVVWAIYNIGHLHNVNEKKIERLIHNFSEMGGDKYDGDDVDDWIHNNCTVRKEGYNIGTLKAFLIQDNPKLYHQVFNKNKSYEETKKEFELTHFKIINPPCYCTIKEDGSVGIQSRKDFNQSHEHLKFKDSGMSQFVDIWFKDPNIRHYDYIDFLPPPLVCPPTTFNMWRGFAAENLKVESSGNIEPVLNHIDILVNHDKKSKLKRILH